MNLIRILAGVGDRISAVSTRLLEKSVSAQCSGSGTVIAHMIMKPASTNIRTAVALAFAGVSLVIRCTCRLPTFREHPKELDLAGDS